VAHPEFANEWWYFTGNLSGDERHLGFELTFFRVAPEAGATLSNNWYLAHFAITDLDRHSFVFHERARRGIWRQAGVEDTPTLEIWNENWRVIFDRTGPKQLAARWGNEQVDLTLATNYGPMLNGHSGWSQKGDQPGEASYYYSYPRLIATGSARTGGHNFGVTGEVWMDHEFGSSQLASQQRGWDWLGLQLTGDEGRPVDLMAFNLRRKDGSRDPHSAGTLRFEDRGRAEDWPFAVSDFSLIPQSWWTSPHTGGRYPVRWRFEMPSHQLSLDIRAAMEGQELQAQAVGVDYWEGAVKVSGTLAGRPIAGAGYLEMTGYAHPFAALTGLSSLR
jgi:predicted secreted hydrolase